MEKQSETIENIWGNVQITTQEHFGYVQNGGAPGGGAGMTTQGEMNHTRSLGQSRAVDRVNRSFLNQFGLAKRHQNSPQFNRPAWKKHQL